MNRYGNSLFTSESVSEGHPDKVCDIISDAVLDRALSLDSESRVACECYASTGLVLVGGEITTEGYIDVIQTARDVLREIGYTDSSDGIDSISCSILSIIRPQSGDISQGVNEGEGLHKALGAGDQGMMFGYACRQTDELMPAPIQYAHQIMRKAAVVRKSGILDFLRPDAKCQVTVRYRDRKPVHIDTVVLSHQHTETVNRETIVEGLIEGVIRPALPPELFDRKTTIHINPTGRFVIGGPNADTGLTGRKTAVDSYGGYSRHGGGAFSGKDPTKVDRSGAYMARYMAKNLVAANVAEEIEIQLAYAIGMANPVSLLVNTFQTKQKDDAIAKMLYEIFDLTPAGIIQELNMKQPIYRETASYGHFGRPNFPWERMDKVDCIQKLIG